MGKYSTVAVRATIGLAAALLSAPQATAITYGFYCISNNSGNCAELAPQLSFDVTDPGGAQVDFTFFNDVGLDSSITDVYFDDSGLLAFASILQSAGVNFSAGASPPNLPGGNGVGFAADFSADSNAPGVPQNGINSNSEFLTVRFNLLGGATYANVIDAIALGFADPSADGTLRIGIHVQGIEPSGNSDALINTPEPGFYGLLALGMGGLCLFLRRNRPQG